MKHHSPETSEPLNYADPSVPAATPSLGAQAARGAVWATAPAVLAKITGFAADIMLAWFLTRKDFGAVGLTVAAAALFGTLQQAGLRDILTQRQKRFDRWATPTFWLSVSVGLACTLLMAASAPLAVRIFDSPALMGLIPLLSVRCLLDALAIVPQAKLQIQLRFRSIGGVAAITTLLQAGLSVQLASPMVGWGPYAVGVPMVLTSAVQAALFWYLARPRVALRARLRRWRWLARDAGFAATTGLVTIAIGYGDSGVLGLVQDQEAVGVYYFAYRLAVQTTLIISTSLAGVLFAALTRIQDTRPRQVTATLSALRMTALISMPLNGLQAATAAPLFHLIYGSRWDAAILPFQLLSVAMAIGILGAPSVSLMRAQGRFGAYLFWSTVASAIYLAAIVAGAWFGSAVGVAAAALGAHSVLTLLWLRNATGGFEGFWTFVASAVVRPLLLAGVAACVAIASRQAIPPLRGSNLLGFLWIGCVMSGTYLVLVRAFMRGAWDEMVQRVQAARGRGAIANTASEPAADA